MAVWFWLYPASGKVSGQFLTFKDVKCLTWQETFQKIRKLISLEFIRHSELEESTALGIYEKEQYHRLASDNANEVDCQMGLQILSLLLHKHYGQECIIIIDETIHRSSRDIIAFFILKS